MFQLLLLVVLIALANASVYDSITKYVNQVTGTT